MADESGFTTPVDAAYSEESAASARAAREGGGDDDAAAGAVTVNIKTLNGADFELAVARHMLVSELKSRVRERTDVEETRQRLIYRGKVLADGEPLSAYKVEDGHYVHMVARPQGIPSPASSTPAGYSDDHDGTTLRPTAADGFGPTVGAPDAARAGTLGQRLLMGMGLPVFASGEGGGGGGGGGGPVHAGQHAGRGMGGAAAGGGIHGGGGAAGSGAFGAAGAVEADNNTLLNAAAGGGLDGGQFLSNMIGLAGAGGGGRGGLVGGAMPTPPLDAVLNSVGGRAAARREGVAVSGVGARGGVPVAAGGAGAGGGDVDGASDLEHVRQGLLTLHTLLSGTASSGSSRRRRRGAPGGGGGRQRRESGSRSAGGADSGPATTVVWPVASAASSSRSALAGGVQGRSTDDAARERPPSSAATEAAATLAAAVEVVDATSETVAPAVTAEVVVEAASEAAASETTAASATAAAKAEVTAAVTAAVAAPAEATALDGATAPVEAAALTEAGGRDAAPAQLEGSSPESAWLRPAFSSAQPAASFDDVSENNAEDEGGCENADADEGEKGVPVDESGEKGGLVSRRSSAGSEGSAPLQRWPFLGREGAREGWSSESSEGPPRMLSSSGESSDAGDAPAGWMMEGGEGLAALRSFLRDSRRESSERALRSFLRDSRRESSERALRSFLRDTRRESNETEEEEEEEEEEDGEEEKEDDRRREGGGGSGGSQGAAVRRFFVGQWLDVKDTVNNWLEATVMDMAESGTKLQIHYNGWPPRWDEWLSWDSPRIAPFRTRTQHLPHSQHVSPAPISAVRNAPITGMDDVRVVMPEVSRVLQEIGPMVEELSACYALHLEQDPSTSPTGERAVSHTLPWTRRRHVQQGLPPREGDGDARAADDAHPKVADLAGDIAPLLDRLGRMLTDVAPHLARLSIGSDRQAAPATTVNDAAAAEREEDLAAEPGEVPWGLLSSQGASQGAARDGRRRRNEVLAALLGGGGRGGGRGRGGGERSSMVSPEETSAAFRQLVSTSSPAPTSSNINIHIHAIVPLRAPPSPPPPPPPPPTASVSAVATPTRADRPPLAVAGSRIAPWGGSLDTASMLAAARAAAVSRAATAARDSETAGGGDSSTPRRVGRGILAEPAARPGGGDRDTTGGGAGNVGAGSILDRSGSVISSASFDVAGIAASPLTISTPGSSATVHSEPPATPTSGESAGVFSGSEVGVAGAGAGPGTGTGGGDQTDSSSSPGGHSDGGGQRRGNGGWRGLLRALGVGGNGNSRVGGGRRDGSDGEQSA